MKGLKFRLRTYIPPSPKEGHCTQIDYRQGAITALSKYISKYIKYGRAYKFPVQSSPVQFQYLLTFAFFWSKLSRHLCLRRVK